MSLNIYQDAIVEAKQLRAVAEQNAKNKIIEAITPQIQMLIEQQLEDELEDDEDLMVDDLIEPSIDLGAVSPDPLDLGLDLDSGDEEDESDDEEGLDPLIGIKVMGDMEIDLDSDDDDDDDDL